MEKDENQKSKVKTALSQPFCCVLGLHSLEHLSYLCNKYTESLKKKKNSLISVHELEEKKRTELV